MSVAGKSQYISPGCRKNGNLVKICLGQCNQNLEGNSRTNSGKAAGVVLKNLPLGGPEGNQTFPWGAAPREILITRVTSRGQISRQCLWLFHC